MAWITGELNTKAVSASLSCNSRCLIALAYVWLSRARAHQRAIATVRSRLHYAVVWLQRHEEGPRQSPHCRSCLSSCASPAFHPPWPPSTQIRGLCAVKNGDPSQVCPPTHGKPWFSESARTGPPPNRAIKKELCSVLCSLFCHGGSWSIRKNAHAAERPSRTSGFNSTVRWQIS